jgi:hypothetical protein
MCQQGGGGRKTGDRYDLESEFLQNKEDDMPVCGACNLGFSFTTSDCNQVAFLTANLVQ